MLFNNMIELKYINGEIFIYGLEDWLTLRKDHRIVGHIVGATHFIPSLPAKLFPEEVLLLLDNKVAEVYETYGSLKDNVEDTNFFEKALLKVQQEEYREVRKVQLESLIDQIVEKRRKTGDNRSKEDILKEELDKSSVVTKENIIWPILLKDSRSNLSLVSYEAVSCLTTPLKSAVFKDLWNRGYHVSNGEKFGGDFLVYFGDPIVHHAIFIVKCIQEKKVLSTTDLIACGRLGVAVKKKAVLASYKNGKVNYITINWIDA